MSVDTIVAAVHVAFPVLGAISITYDDPNPGEARYDFAGHLQLPPGYDADVTGPHFIVHELGHALRDFAARSRGYHAGRDPRDLVLSDFWTARGYPGTWQQADVASQQLLHIDAGDYQAAYRLMPEERFAECFVAVWLSWPLECQDPKAVPGQSYLKIDPPPGVPLNAARMLNYFKTCHLEVPVGTLPTPEEQLAQDIAKFDADLTALGPNALMNVSMFQRWRELLQRELDLKYVAK